MESRPQLSLDTPAKYCICVQGYLDYSYAEELGGLIVVNEFNRHCPPTTLLIGWLMDQAVLFGVLNRLYALNLPLLSIECLAVRPAKND